MAVKFNKNRNRTFTNFSSSIAGENDIKTLEEHLATGKIEGITD